MTDKRRTIPDNALLELGGINGLLHEMNGQRPLSNRHLEDIGKPRPAKEDTPKPEKADDVRTDGKDSGNTVELPDERPEENGDEKATGKKTDYRKATSDKEKTTIPQDRSRRTSKGSCWDEIIARYNKYGSVTNRSETMCIWLDRHAVETIRSCFGKDAVRFINALLVWAIENNREKLRQMQSLRTPLL